MVNETKGRSATKSVIWRILGVFILAIVTFAYTREWITTTWITFLHHGIFLFVFYLNERFWQHVDYKKIFANKLFRPLVKCMCYETILGTLILGIITLIVTGNVQQMSQITITYIGIKHIVFVINEFVWGRIKWRSW